jgi:DNA-binding transcriptional regulator YhcF (GntR family)
MSEVDEENIRRTRVEDVRNQVLDKIVDGELKPGERIGEVAIAKKLGVSRTPVREAFRLLAAEGWVVAEAHRGVFVTKPAVPEVVELVEAFTEVVVDCLEQVLRAGPSDLGTGAAVYRSLVAATPNRALRDVVFGLERRVRMACGGLPPLDEVARAVADGDRKRAERALRRALDGLKPTPIAASEPVRKGAVPHPRSCSPQRRG